jgi:glucose/arabinose dehydrogenase
MRKLALGLALSVALVSISIGHAQEASITGLQFVADNAATASAAAAVAPLSAVPVTGSNLSLDLPQGFAAAVLASGLRNPRFMAFDPDGNLLVADAAAGSVYRYPSAGGSISTSDRPPAPLISGLNAPSNVALFGAHLYVGETNAISRYAYDPASPAGAREVVVSDLPTGGHSTRTIAFGPDGLMYVGIGSSCNICHETDPRRAAVSRYAPDGTGYQRFAYGTRNPVGLAFQPSTGLLWATVNERDNQGNEIPPDLVTILQQDQNFGWPNCQPPDATPQTAGADCSGVTPPTIGIQAHSAPLGLAFYTGQQFPGDYASDLFVAQHGSWNRTPPAAPKLLRLHFNGAQPVSAQDFATGWQAPDGSRSGRPAGVVVAPDGSLIVSDDQRGVLYRIAYTG